jgi:S-adenosylmethionine synthetase
MPAIWIEAAQEALPIGIAEKKGLGHPDTICDEITERISVELSKYYLREFGAIQHHNVDKALLIGGVSEPAYGGGKIVKPMSLIVAGRATTLVRGKPIPVEDIAVETAREWLRRHLPHLDVEKHVQISAQIRSGR